MMKIDVNGAYRAYAKNTPPVQRGTQPEERGGSVQDRVSISAGAHKSELDRLVYSTAAEVEAKASPARLGELKQAVAAGTYQVPAEKLADAMLDAYI